MENNITDAAKIKQLIAEIYPSTSMGDFGLKEMLVQEAMTWKEKQTIEKVCEWLIQNGDNYIASIFDCGKPEIHYLKLELINDLKRAIGK